MRHLATAVAFAWISALLGVTAFCPWTAFAQGNVAREPVAIMAFDSVGASPAEVSATTDRLQDLLLRTNKFQLVDRARIDAVLKEQAFQQTGCTSTECAVQVGKVLGVHKLITGKVTKLDETHWVVSAALIDVESAETLRAPSLPYEGRFFDFLQNEVPTLADRLAGESGQQAAPPPPIPAAAPPPPETTAADHTGPKQGFGIALGTGSTSGTATFSGGATATYTIQGIALGADYQWAISEKFSAGVYLRVTSGNVGGDEATSYKTGSSGGLGGEIRYWFDQAFIGGLVGVASTTLSASSTASDLTESGSGIGLVAGYEWLAGWHVLVSIESASLSGTLTTASSSKSFTSKESQSLLLVGYRF
ncbi:MAG: CsgG/HfaB family protein [SAR324 cluster bacterium]